MDQPETSNKIVVFSDIHFGVIHDPTENEESNITDLLNLLDLIETEILPKKIILLGDVFDLWRVEFKDAWDNAHDISFFERLSSYSEKHGAEIIYIIGNHDHFLKEISYAKETLNRYGALIASDVSSGIALNLNVMLGNLDIDKILNVKFYYPHYKLDDIPELGTIYFDHGHFNVQEERLIKKVLSKIYKYGAKYFSNSRIFEKDLESNDSKEIYNDLEANFSAVFSLLYHSKTDDIVRGGRDFIWRLKKKTWLLFSGILSAVIGGIISLAPQLLSDKGLDDITSQFGHTHVLNWGILTVIIYLFPRLSSILISRIVTSTVSSERGTPVDKILPNITKKDVSIERKNYKYINLMQDLGNEGKKIDYYIFGHTHMAGWIKDTESELTVYNSGGWVKDPHKKTCINSFIIIDPAEKDTDRIKIYHMEKQGKVPCSFDKRGRCNLNCGK